MHLESWGYKIELPTLTLQQQQANKKNKVNKQKNLSYVHST